MICCWLQWDSAKKRMDSEQLDMLVCLNNGVLRFYNPKKYRNFFHLMDDELGHPLVFEKTNQEYCSWFSTFRREHPWWDGKQTSKYEILKEHPKHRQSNVFKLDQQKISSLQKYQVKSPTSYRFRCVWRGQSFLHFWHQKLGEQQFQAFDLSPSDWTYGSVWSPNDY